MKRDLFRIFGSPFSIVFHQHLTYLHLKRFPVKTYGGSYASSKLYSLFYRCRNAFCALTPDGKSCLLPWHLIQAVEEKEKRGGHNSASSMTRRVLLHRDTHPTLHMLSWVCMVYATWWLTLTGASYRWIHGDAHTIVAGYLNYFLMLNGMGVIGATRPKFKEAMIGLLSVHGVDHKTEPFMREHFETLCKRLDDHFIALEAEAGIKVDADASRGVSLSLARRRAGHAVVHPTIKSDLDTADIRKQVEELQSLQHPQLYLLGTPHPTLADVAFGSVFSAYFLLDDPPASTIEDQFPALSRYLQRCCGMPNTINGELFAFPPSDEEEARERAPFDDTVPPSLVPVLKLMTNVLPLMADQCEAFQSYMGSEKALKMKKETLDASAGEELAGLDAYLFPQRTDISCVLLVDRHILTIWCRAQDLEIATVAAREVLDDDLAPFNRLKGGESSSCEETSPAVSSPADRLLESEDVSGSAHNDEIVSVPSQGPANTNVTTEDELQGETQDREPPLTHLISSKARKHVKRFAWVESDAAVAGTDQLTQTLDTLRTLLRRMHTPNFTLHGVTHRRRLWVAAIPEHVYAERRAKLSNQASSSK